MQFQNMKEELLYLKKRYELMQQLEFIVNLKGYIKVEPDYFEPYERFVRMNKRILKESMVKILQNDGSISILRPDITTNIIKQVIPKWTDDIVLKLYYTATTFSQKPGLPIKEDKQFGIELLGNDNQADIETVSLMLSIFETFETDYIIEIGNQRFLNALINGLQLNDEDERLLKDIIETKNQSALNDFIASVDTSNYKTILMQIFDLEGSIETIKNKLSNLKLDPIMQKAIEEIDSIDKNINLDKTNPRVTYDLSLISKYDYYDGITFKGYLRNISYPILSGGRYDPLTQAFGARISAIGFTLNLNEFIKEVIK
jgi:ATP phosphoribosyltransferase regulatory subunit